MTQVNNTTKKPTKNAAKTSKASKGFTAEERAAMKEHIQELKASTDKAEAEKAEAEKKEKIAKTIISDLEVDVVRDQIFHDGIRADGHQGVAVRAEGLAVENERTHGLLPGTGRGARIVAYRKSRSAGGENAFPGLQLARPARKLTGWGRLSMIRAFPQATPAGNAPRFDPGV